MAHPMGEANLAPLRVDFDRRLMLEFHGSRVTSDAGLLAYRELDEALGLTALAGDVLADSRSGKNGWHGLVGLLRQSVFGRLAGYEDVNDADRLGRDPVMRWIVGGKAIERGGASTSQMGRFETELLATDDNLAALADLPGVWIDRVHERKPPTVIVLDMDSSVSPTHGDQEGTAYNGHFGCTCYHPLFVFNQFGDLERCALRPGNVHSADDWRDVLEPVVMRYRARWLRRYFRADAAFAMPEVYEFLEAESFRYAIRLPANRGIAAEHRASAQAAGRQTAEGGPAVSCKLQLSGPELDQAPPGRGQGGMASRRAVPQGRLHRDQPGPPRRAGGRLLQSAWHCRAAHQGGQARHQVDAPLVPQVPTQCRAAPASRTGLQSR